METDFPTVKDSISLEDTFPLYQHGLPVAVVDQKGKFVGIVEDLDIFTSIAG